MEDQLVETLWVKVYDGKGAEAKLIFEGTARQWGIFRTGRDSGCQQETISQDAAQD